MNHNGILKRDKSILRMKLNKQVLLMRLKMKVTFKEVNKKLSKIKDNLLMMSKMLMENTMIKKITNKNIKKHNSKEKLLMKNKKMNKSSFNLQLN